MKNLANYISLSRIVLSCSMIFTEPLSFTFFIIFIICGISDIVDGYIARKMNLNTQLGSKLDSYADIIFFLSYMIVLLPILRLSNFMIFWIIIIFLIRLCSIVVGYGKFGKFSSIHTNLNKLTGLSLFFFPFSLLLTISDEFFLIVILFISTLASLEEFIIIITIDNLDSDYEGVLNYISWDNFF